MRDVSEAKQVWFNIVVKNWQGERRGLEEGKPLGRQKDVTTSDEKFITQCTEGWTTPMVYQRESLKTQRKKRWFWENFFPPFPRVFLNCFSPKSQGKSWWNQPTSLKPVSDSVCLLVKEEEGFSLPSLQIWKVSLNPQSFRRSHLSLSCCKIQLTCAFSSDNSQISYFI